MKAKASDGRKFLFVEELADFESARGYFLFLFHE
jgi:hypothetical protein